LGGWCQHIDVNGSRVRYAKNGDTRIAYGIWGDAGPVVVSCVGWTVGGLDDMGDPAGPYSQLLGTFPTVVLARPGDRYVPFEASAALAAGIPGAEFKPLPPGEHRCFDIIDLVVSATLEFACDQDSSDTPQRVLTTVLFTDIVGSTELLSAHGDAHWRHHSACTTPSSTVNWRSAGQTRQAHRGWSVRDFDARRRPVHARSSWSPRWPRAAYRSV
jgi:hypothetical protein